MFFYLATVNTRDGPRKDTPASVRSTTADRARLDRQALGGLCSYVLTLPANIPALGLLVDRDLYDPQTHSKYADQPSSCNSQRDALTYDDDGSITLRFRPDHQRSNPRTGFARRQARGGSRSLRLPGRCASSFDHNWVPSSDVGRP